MLQNPGALIDTRPKEEQAKDPQFKEVVASINPVNWVEKPQSEWRRFPIQNQNGSGSCVAQTMRKIMGVYVWLKTNVFVLLSASHIYQRRQNRPAAGMSGLDAFDIAQKGVTLEDFAPSESMTDAQMDNQNVLPFMEEIGKIFKIGQPLVVPTKDIDTIASIIQTTGKAVMVWFYFTYPEWTNTPTVTDPNLDLYAPSTLRHSVAAVDFTLYQGKRALIIDESWGQNTALNGQRIITEDFFKARNFFAAHFMNFAFEGTPSPIKPTYDGSVISLQNCLKHYGTFPSNVESTGFMGGITWKAVRDFQVREGLHPTGVNNLGPLTVARLKALYP